MEVSEFDKIISRITDRGRTPKIEDYFTFKDLYSMNREQLKELVLTMFTSFIPGPGSFSTSKELYILLEYLDEFVTINKDKGMNKLLNYVSSLVCLTRFEGYLDRIENLPNGLRYHLERIIGPDPVLPDFDKEGKQVLHMVSMSELQPTLQIATFIAYPLLEGILRRMCDEYVDIDGMVKKEFQVNRKKYCPDCDWNRINNIEDEFRLLEQIADEDLKEIMKVLYKWRIPSMIWEWRCMSLHGELTSNWHSLAIIHVIYLLLLSSKK